MSRFILNVLLVSVVAYGMTAIGWLSPNSSAQLPLIPVSEHKEIVVLLMGAVLFVVLDILLDVAYALFLVGTLGLGCVTLPLWIVASGALVLWCTSLSGLWIVTTPPLFFLVSGFVLSVMGNIAKGMTSSSSSSESSS